MNAKSSKSPKSTFRVLTRAGIDAMPPRDKAVIYDEVAEHLDSCNMGYESSSRLHTMLDGFFKRYGQARLSFLEVALARYSNALARKALREVEVIPLEDFRKAVRDCMKDAPQTANSFLRQTESATRRALLLCHVPAGDLRNL